VWLSDTEPDRLRSRRLFPGFLEALRMRICKEIVHEGFHACRAGSQVSKKFKRLAVELAFASFTGENRKGNIKQSAVLPPAKRSK
jgi:hypothetical protein